jgi:nucleoside-diphosphate-sugar epimerase
VYSRDIADSAVALLDAEDPKSVVYNSSGPESWTLESWCKRLTGRVPGFSYRIGEDANIELNNPRDRGVLDMSRLETDAGFTPQYGLDKSFEDYMNWIDGQSDFADTPL